MSRRETVGAVEESVVRLTESEFYAFAKGLLEAKAVYEAEGISKKYSSLALDDAVGVLASILLHLRMSEEALIKDLIKEELCSEHRTAAGLCQKCFSDKEGDVHEFTKANNKVKEESNE